MLTVHLPCRQAWQCDMLENNLQALAVEGGCVNLDFRPFEVKTVRLQI
jgi:alpha-mannosidase